LVLFQRQMVLTAEKVKRMLMQGARSASYSLSVGIFARTTYHRAMLSPQIDFISRQVDLEVPIHCE